MDRIQEIARLVDQCDSDELRQVWEICKRRSSALAQTKVATFRVGQRVSFTGRDGEELTGIVKKLNMKTASVEVPRKVGTVEFPQTWRVSPSLLRAAS